MSRLTVCLPLVALTAFACAPVAPPAIVATPAPLASTPVATPAPTLTPSPASPLPTPSYPGGILLLTDNHLTPMVGTSVLLRAVGRYPQVPVTGAKWELDASDAQKAVITPNADGSSCLVAVRQPGAIRVRASIGATSAHVIMVATTAPPPGKLVQVDLPGAGEQGYYHGGFYFNNTPVVIRTAAEWTRYWQGVSAYTAKTNYGSSGGPIPPLPAVDLETSSLVVLGYVFGSWRPEPALARVEAEGEGLVEVGFPEEDTNAPGLATQYRSLRVYQVPKLPATTKLVYDCRLERYCEPAEPLPSPAPLAGIAAQTLLVGQTLDLPTQNQGVELKWSLAPQTAARATLEGNHLVPKQPGLLVLDLEAAGERMQVVDAVAASAELNEWLDAVSGTPHAVLEGGPRVLRSQAEWNELWAKLWYPPGTGADQPWTAPPPPPPAPTVDFSTRNVLAAVLNTSVKPVIMSLEGATITMGVPGTVRSGQFTPATPTGAGPTYFYQVPKLEGTPTIQIEANPAP